MCGWLLCFFILTLNPSIFIYSQWSWILDKLPFLHTGTIFNSKKNTLSLHSNKWIKCNFAQNRKCQERRLCWINIFFFNFKYSVKGMSFPSARSLNGSVLCIILCSGCLPGHQQKSVYYSWNSHSWNSATFFVRLLS